MCAPIATRMSKAHNARTGNLAILRATMDGKWLWNFSMCMAEKLDCIAGHVLRYRTTRS